MAKKIPYSKWKKIATENVEEPKEIEFQLGEEVVTVLVTPRIPYTNMMVMLGMIVEQCAPVKDGYRYDENTPDQVIDLHRVPHLEYLNGVYRANVLSFYTNLDFGSDKATMDAIWEFAGNDEIYDRIRSNIQDDIYSLYEIAYKRLSDMVDPMRKLAGRINGFLDTIASDEMKAVLDAIAKIQENSEILGLPPEEAIRVVTGG